jgi:uncharacterized delta-60 repeat protein
MVKESIFAEIIKTIKMRTVISCFLLYLVTCLPFQLIAQTGTLDMTFDLDGIGQYSPGPGHSNCNDMVVFPDNKMLVAGVVKLNGITGPFSGMLLKILENGSIDLAWGTSGMVSFMYASDTYVNCVALQPDGKILIAGHTTIGPNDLDMFVGRFNADGTPDLTFNATGHIVLPYSTGEENCYAMALQPDGKIVIAGGIFMGASTLLFARVNANGTLDTGFGVNGYRSINSSSSTEFIQSLGILSNGTIVGMGYAAQGAPLWADQAIMVKLTPGGAPMPGFGSNGVLIPSIFNNIVSLTNGITINNDVIYATGDYAPPASSKSIFLTKLDSNGVASPAFGNGGVHLTNLNPSNVGYKVKVFGDSKIYVTGLTGPAGFGDNNIITLRYTSNGLPDLSWNGTGYTVTSVRPDGDCGYAIDIQTDGKVVVGGTSNGMSTSGSNEVAVIRYLNDYGGFFANFTVSDSTLCNAATVTFINQSSPSVTSYLWTFQGGTPSTSTAVNPTVTYSTTGYFDVTLQVFKGSQNVTKLKDNFIQVTVIPGTPGMPAGNASVCQGSSTLYTINSVNNATSYIWEVTPPAAGNISGMGTTATFLASLTWTGNYTIKVKADNYCGGSSFSPGLACSVNTMPWVFNLTGNGNFCQGQPGAQLILESSQTGINYELFLNGAPAGVILPGTGSPLNFGYLSAPGSYTCTGSSGPCAAVMPGVINVQMIAIPGTAAIPTGPSITCNNISATYSTISNQADTVLWTLTPSSAGSVLTTGPLQVEITWSAMFSGTAQLSATGQNQCGTGTTSPVLDVLVKAAANPQISGSSLVCQQTQHDYQTAGTLGNTYQWTVSGGNIVSGAGTNQVNIWWGAPGAGSILLIETTLDNCVSVSAPYNVTIDACTDIPDQEKQDRINLYPNPAGEEIFLSGSDVPDISSVWLFNTTGICLQGGLVVQKPGDEILRVRLENLHGGIYFIQTRMIDGTVKIFRFVKLSAGF